MTRRSLRRTTKQRPQRLYVYKLTADNGGAPCTDGGELLTLAICKPMIRTTAQVGDLIFGFAANSLSADNRLIYIARVTAIERDGEYYKKAVYRGRRDRIYFRGRDGRFRVRRGARYHGDGSLLTHDLGIEPDYRRALVLVSDDFRYFGKADAVDLAQYPRIQAVLRRLGPGHRVNHAPALERELRKLQQWAWNAYPGVRKIGPPTADAR